MFGIFKKFFYELEKKKEIALAEKERNQEIKENAINERGEYLSCRYIQGGVTFMHSAIRACCSHKCGVTFVEPYAGEDIDWKKIDVERKKLIENCKSGIIPERCKGCVDLEKKRWDDKPLIDDIFLNYWIHCNCGCVYCVQAQNGEYLVKDSKPSNFYDAYKHIKYLYENNMVSKNAHVELVGGDLTVLDEAEDIINTCLDYGVGRMSFHSSCIYYSNALERALREVPNIDFDFSIDCGSRELYKKIKRIDAFDQVIENVKRYLSVSEYVKKGMIAKYIIVDGLNDSVEELAKWLDLMHEIGIKNTKVDVNFKRFFPEFNHANPTVPPHYYEMFEYYNKKILEYGINDHCWEFTRRVIQEGGIPKGY